MLALEAVEHEDERVVELVVEQHVAAQRVTGGRQRAPDR